MALQQLRTNILAASPQAVEAVSTGVPAFRYRGKYLVSMSAAKNHLSLFMMRGDALKTLKSALGEFETTNVALRFTAEKPVPASLVSKVISVRVREIDLQEGS